MYELMDLHCHSNCSDGMLSPEQLCKKALAAGVSLLALTDHDTTAGLADLHHAARDTSLNVVDGVELSVRWKLHDIHIIGLKIDPTAVMLETCLAEQKVRRITRAKQIAANLIPFGVDNAYEKACDIAGHDRVGRPHFAQVLVAEGVVANAAQAFKRLLVRGRPAYASIQWMNLQSAIEVIQQTGGKAVIAHPMKYRLTRTQLHELIKAFKALGGEGIEVVSGAMSILDVQELAGLCVRFDLLASTGSDYHGDNMSLVGLGQQAKLPVGCKPIFSSWTVG